MRVCRKNAVSLLKPISRYDLDILYRYSGEMSMIWSQYRNGRRASWTKLLACLCSPVHRLDVRAFKSRLDKRRWVSSLKISYHLEHQPQVCRLQTRTIGTSLVTYINYKQIRVVWVKEGREDHYTMNCNLSLLSSPLQIQLFFFVYSSLSILSSYTLDTFFICCRHRKRRFVRFFHFHFIYLFFWQVVLAMVALTQAHELRSPQASQKIQQNTQVTVIKQLHWLYSKQTLTFD